MGNFQGGNFLPTKPLKIYRISDAVKLLGVSKRAVFRYEKSGVFPPPRRSALNGWREHAEKDIEKIKKLWIDKSLKELKSLNANVKRKQND